MDSKLMVFFLQCLKNEKEPLALFQACITLQEYAATCATLCQKYTRKLKQKVPCIV